MNLSLNAPGGGTPAPAWGLLMELSMDPMQRFWQKVDRRGDDECWIWRGRVRKDYGEFVIYSRGKSLYFRAHRVALGGLDPVFSQLFACHHCDNPLCCNPKHLYWGSAATNNADRVKRERNGCSAGKGVACTARAMHASGCSIAQIAKSLGVTRHAVRFAVRNPNARSWKKKSVNPPPHPPLAGA